MRRRTCLFAPIAATLGRIAPAHAAADDVIRIGAAVSLTGQYAREGRQLRQGYDYWTQAANQAGGIMVQGRLHQVDVLYYDDESQPQTAARLTERLISDDGVKFLFGPYSSGIATATAAIAERYRVLSLMPMATSDGLYTRGYRYVFGPSPLASRTLIPMLDMVAALPNRPTTIAVAGPDDLYPNLFATAVKSRAAELGLKVVYDGRYPKGSVDLSTIATAIKASDADILLGTGYVQDSILLIRSLKELRVEPKMVGLAMTVSLPDFRTAVGAADRQLFGIAIWDQSLSYTGPLVGSAADYARGYQARFGESPSPFAASGTAAGLVLQEAILQADSLDGPKVRMAMLGLDTQTFFGNVRFDAAGVNQRASAVVIQIQDDKPVVVFPRDVAQAAPQYPRTAAL